MTESPMPINMRMSQWRRVLHFLEEEYSGDVFLSGDELVRAAEGMVAALEEMFPGARSASALVTENRMAKQVKQDVYDALDSDDASLSRRLDRLCDKLRPGGLAWAPRSPFDEVRPVPPRAILDKGGRAS